MNWPSSLSKEVVEEEGEEGVGMRRGGGEGERLKYRVYNQSSPKNSTESLSRR
jgi:hypothetical protein